MLDAKTLVPLDHEITVYNTMAKQANASKLYRNVGDEAAVMTIMLSARELGIPPMSALNGGLNVIKGKVEISARLMNALIRRAGHSIQTLKLTDTECTIKGKRADNGDEMTASFTMEDAKKADLLRGGSGWSKFPQDMLFARALSRLARRLFSDVIGVAYVEGEISESTSRARNEEVSETPLEESVETQFWVDYFDHTNEMQTYTEHLMTKYDVTMEDILRKYQNSKEKFTEKFEEWLVKNKKIS